MVIGVKYNFWDKKIFRVLRMVLTPGSLKSKHYLSAFLNQTLITVINRYQVTLFLVMDGWDFYPSNASTFYFLITNDFLLSEFFVHGLVTHVY